MARRSTLLATVILGLSSGCEGSSPLGRPEEPPRVELELLAVRPLHPRPWGLALSPDRRHLVVSDFLDGWVYVLDAENYEPVGTRVGAGEPRGIVIEPGVERTTVLVAGERPGLTLWSLSPEGQLVLVPPLDREWASFIARSEVTGSIYATLIVPADDRVVARLGSDGSILASRPVRASVRAGLAPTEDGERVLAIEDESSPSRLLILDADDLALLAATEVPPWAIQVVPLDGISRAAVVGGEGGEPLVAVVAWEEDRTGPIQRLGAHPGRAGFVDVGRGNTWVRIDPHTALVGTTHGILAVDTRTGAAAHVEGDFDDGTHVNQCCSMAWDSGRQRLLVASSVAPFAWEAGRLEVYRVRKPSGSAERD